MYEVLKFIRLEDTQCQCWQCGKQGVLSGSLVIPLLQFVGHVFGLLSSEFVQDIVRGCSKDVVYTSYLVQFICTWEQWM